MKDLDTISFDVVGEAIRIHRELGPGLLESVYEAFFAVSLVRPGYQVSRQVPEAIECKGLNIDGAFRVDSLVDGKLVVDIKSVEKLGKIHANNCSLTLGR